MMSTHAELLRRRQQVVQMALPAGWVGLVLGNVAERACAASMTVWMRPLSLDAVSGTPDPERLQHREHVSRADLVDRLVADRPQ